MILTFVSQKGGVGKSTLAMQVAYEWTYRGKSVALVDADPQGSCIGAGKRSAAAELDAPTVVAMQELARPNQVPKLAKAYDHVVIDTPAGIGDLPRAAVLLADVAIIPVTPGLSVWALRRSIEIVKDVQNGPRPQLLGALISNCNDPRNAMGIGAREALASQDLGLPVFKAQTFDRIAWVESTMDGIGVARHPHGDSATEELQAFIAELERFARKAKVAA